MATPFDDPAPPAPRTLRTALAAGLLAFLVGLAVMAWALTRWEPAKRLIAGENAPATTMADMAQPALPAAPTVSAPIAAPTPAPMPQTLDGRLAELEGRMARIDLRAAAAAGNAARAEGLLIAFAARRAVDRGVALGYLEGELRQRFGETQPRAVATIVAASQNPVTLDSLKGELEALRPRLAGVGPSEDWWQSTRRTLGNLIIVRREGSGSPAPDQRLARAELQLASGQVDQALAEVSRLPGNAVAAPWMARARRLVEAHRALDVIEAAALTEGEGTVVGAAAVQANTRTEDQ